VFLAVRGAEDDTESVWIWDVEGFLQSLLDVDGKEQSALPLLVLSLLAASSSSIIGSISSIFAKSSASLARNAR
jgi:hypothetical protein